MECVYRQKFGADKLLAPPQKKKKIIFRPGHLLRGRKWQGFYHANYLAGTDQEISDRLV